jgi:capsular exopolysaccharide synthesis family protein
LIADYESISRELSHDESGMESIKGQMADNNEIQFEYDTLKRDYEYNQQIYSAFLKQYKETDAIKSGNVQSINARMLNKAVPASSPYKPNKRNMLVIGLFIGVLFGLGLAFLIEHFDNTFKSSDEVESRLNLPVIGMLPNIFEKETDISPALQFVDSPKSAFAESIRTLRTGVLLSLPDNDKKAILVTSTVPSEGKTTIAINLAHSLSHLGETILVEADLRRPMVKKSLGDDDSIGLSSMISGQNSYSECVSNGKKIKNLHILSSGPIPPNPLELLSSDKFDNLLKQLREKYKFVVIDCAPVMAVSDALTLSQKVDGVLFVIKHEATPSQLVESAVTKLSRSGAKILGVALNRLKSNKARYGKYYKYEGHYYGHYGYHANKQDSKKRA